MTPCGVHCVKFGNPQIPCHSGHEVDVWRTLEHRHASYCLEYLVKSLRAQCRFWTGPSFRHRLVMSHPQQRDRTDGRGRCLVLSTKRGRRMVRCISLTAAAFPSNVAEPCHTLEAWRSENVGQPPSNLLPGPYCLSYLRSVHIAELLCTAIAVYTPEALPLRLCKSVRYARAAS